VEYSVTVRTEDGQPGMHIVLVEVLDPGGAVRAHYNAKLVARGGRTSGRFVPALNDPPGNWTIRATDYVTRTTGTAHVTLRLPGN
jgi:hypothetical protein